MSIKEVNATQVTFKELKERNKEKPIVIIFGTDTLYDIAEKARPLLYKVTDKKEAEKAISQLFSADRISNCIKGIEKHLEVTYRFGDSN